ncbi:MAG: 3-dehydroquinate synthase [Cyclobacteriaceae bacterium]
MNLPDSISFISSPADGLKSVLEKLIPDKVVFLVDENTRQYCLPHFELGENENIIEIKSGEINKNLNTCTEIWSQLTHMGFGRKSLLVNVGGGVIGDMGGFCASTYKRGIRFINFPTTLLAMVDANIGGKLGIDFQGFKNHIGVFQDPENVLIYDGFLKTLPARELRSGFAEVIKHGLIYDRNYWETIKSGHFPDFNWQQIVEVSAKIKHEVVTEDPKEAGLRKILNFGHTLGHAIETWYLNNQISLLHGEAIAVGMILEGHLAMQLGNLQESELTEITSYIQKIYDQISLPDFAELVPLMLQDKKNIGNELSFSLLNGIGGCLYDQKVDENMIHEAMNFYSNLK